MKKTPVVSSLLKESTIDYASHITKLIFTSGCNFRCSYCHNSVLWEKRRNTLTYPQLTEMLDQARENWVDAICITGGEPTIHPDLAEMIRFIKQQNFMVKLDTNGSHPDMVEELLEVVDYFAMDYKASLEHYPKITRVNIDPALIRRSRDLIIQRSRDYEFRTTVVPGFHKPGEIRQICRELQGSKRVVFQPFVPKEELLDNDYIRVKRTRKDLLEQVLTIARKALPESEVICR